MQNTSRRQFFHDAASAVSVAALAEQAGHGGAVAAPLVKDVMRAYFLKQCRLRQAFCPLAPKEEKVKEEKESANVD